MKRFALLCALWLLAGNAEAQQALSYIQLSPTPNYLANGGPGFVQIDAGGHPFIAQAIPGSGTVTNAASLANNAMVVGDGGGAGIKTVGGSIGGSFTTAGALSFTGAASGATFALPAGGPFTFTYPLVSQTLASLAGTETLTNKTYSSGVFGGTFSGNFTLSGIPKLTGLSAGAQVSCLGLNATNDIVLLGAGCSAGGGGSVSITSLSPNILVAPSPLTGTGTIASTVPLNTQSGNTGYTVVVGDAAKVVNRTNTITQTDPIPQATGSFTSGFGFNYQTGTVGNTLTSTTSTINGIAGATGIKVGAQQQVSPFSDGANWHAALGVPQPATQTGTTFLRDDMTWASPAGAGTVTNAANLTNNAIVLGDGGTTGVKTTATGTGVVTALGVNIGSAGAFGVTNLAQTWSATQTISLNAGALPAATANFRVGGANATTNILVLDAFGATNSLLLRRSAGTAASPTALQTNDAIGGIAGFGYGATGYSATSRVAIQTFADQNWTDTAQGTALTLYTTLNGTTTLVERWRLSNDGGITVNDASGVAPTGGSKGAGTINVTGGYYINNVAVSGGGGITCPTNFTAVRGQCVWTKTATTDATNCPASKRCIFYTGLVNDEYDMRCHGIQATSATADMVVRYGEGGTPTYGTGATAYNNTYSSQNAAVEKTNQTDSGIFAPFHPPTSGADSASLFYQFHDFTSTTRYKYVQFQANNVTFTVSGMAYYSTDTNAITAIQLIDRQGTPDHIDGTCTLIATGY